MIYAVFPDSVKEITVYGLTQWDKGRKLQITLPSLPASFEVHFANKRAEIAYVVKGTASGGVATVSVPNIVLMNSADVVAWVYDSQSDATGETIATINLPLARRTKPADYYYTEDELVAVDYVALEKRVASLEKAGSSGATTEQLAQIEKNRQDINKLSGQISDLQQGGSGVTTAMSQSLWAIMQKTAFAEQLTDAELNAFKTAWKIDVETIPCTGITLSKTSLSFTNTTNQTLTATVTPNNTTDKVVWTSNNNAVATVTNGVVKPLSNGSATITATCGSKSATCSVTVDIAEEEQVTLSSISATYTGGDVAVGTALTALRGITVTARYSDGSTATITDYTLSGTIAEGSNIITVNYSGKTTTFTVTGIAESGGEEEGTFVYDATKWTSGRLSNDDGSAIDADNSFKEYYDEYIDISGGKKLTIYSKHTSVISLRVYYYKADKSFAVYRSTTLDAGGSTDIKEDYAISGTVYARIVSPLTGMSEKITAMEVS